MVKWFVHSEVKRVGCIALRIRWLWICLLAGCVDGSGRPQLDEVSPITAQDVSLKALNYEQVQKFIQSHLGKVVVVDAWATWCPPCLKEFPSLVRLSKRHSSNDLVCISLSCDYQGLDRFASVQARVVEFLETQSATFENVICTEESGELFHKMGIPSIPAVFVYGREGHLQQQFGSTTSGPFTYEDVAEVVEVLLGI